ncbi:hypothetical protein E0E50_15225 [Azotobacter chroococcum subsp. isscasi]|uniref:hypothetical protein n=1 Tax=Azotobacter chroococcum TaxID=353 RepID=UPI00103C437F|nr:hypothetical protein [Azotobacter chroococcum]TBW08309.1 hypothetical protein E0E50_15225 [Azotobacter chroococcum subsp. isscasi]
MTRAKLQTAERPVLDLPWIELGLTDVAEIRRAKAAELALLYSDPDSALHARMEANWVRRQEALTRMLIRRLDRMYAAQAVEDRAMHRRWAVRWAHAAMVS